MVDLETELRSALAERASTVPGTIAEQLCRKNYRPRGARRSAVITTAGLACAAAAAGGVYAGTVYAGTQAHGPSHAPASQTVRLDGYSVNLHGTTLAHSFCRSRSAPDGRPETVKQAGGFFRGYDGGCLHLTLGPPRAPADARPVRVGTYHGYLRLQPATGTITLYVDGSTKNWLVFTVTHSGPQSRQLIIAARQLIAFAARGIPPCSPELEYAPSCAAG